jgi:hypothetical protein
MGISPLALSRNLNAEKFTPADREKPAAVLKGSWNTESREWFNLNDTGEEIWPDTPFY